MTSLNQPNYLAGTCHRHLVLKIIDYLRQHPEARDNLRGISEWWLECPLELSEPVLAYLCRKGFLKKSHHNGQALYSKDASFPKECLCDLIESLPAENG